MRVKRKDLRKTVHMEHVHGARPAASASEGAGEHVGGPQPCCCRLVAEPEPLCLGTHRQGQKAKFLASDVI